MLFIRKNLVVLLIFMSFVTFSQNWLTDYDLAKQEATQKDRKIILVFSGSDWCAPCIKLDKEIWKSTEFKDYATSNLVMLKADFPRRKKNTLTKQQQSHNNALAEKYNPKGFFPLVVMLDNEGIVLGETGYLKRSPKEFIKLITSY